MQIQVTTAPDPTLIAAATRRGLQRPVMLARAAGWTALLAATIMLIRTGNLNPVLLTLGAACAVLVPLVLLNHTARQAMRNRGLTTYEISERGVASSGDASRHAYAWRAFRSVEELSGQLLFRLGSARYLPVPTTGLSPAQIDQVLGAASARGLRVRRRQASAAGVLSRWARCGS